MACLVIFEIWASHLRSEVIVTPRSFIFCVISSLGIIDVNEGVVLRKLIVRIVDFNGFTCILFLRASVATSSRISSGLLFIFFPRGLTIILLMF